MATIQCPKCGAEINSLVGICHNCGFGAKPSGKVTVLGYREPFALYPAVKIYRNGMLIGKVEHDRQIELEINEQCKLQFKCSIRSAECVVKPGDWVLLSFNRTTGKLNATCTDENNIQNVVTDAQKSDGKHKIIAAVIIALAIILWILRLSN
jgi:hypothetical protein